MRKRARAAVPCARHISVIVQSPGQGTGRSKRRPSASSRSKIASAAGAIFAVSWTCELYSAPSAAIVQSWNLMEGIGYSALGPLGALLSLLSECRAA
jgi:hypothetical protein